MLENDIEKTRIIGIPLPHPRNSRRLFARIGLALLVTGMVGTGTYFLLIREPVPKKTENVFKQPLDLTEITEDVDGADGYPLKNELPGYVVHDDTAFVATVERATINNR